MNTLLIYRGTSDNYDFVVYDNDGVAKNLTGYTTKIEIFRDASSAALVSIAGSFLDAANGSFRVVLSSSDISALDKDYYPYKVTYNDGARDYLHEIGTININNIDNPWEWGIDIFTGKNRSSIRTKRRDFLKYTDPSWTNAKFDKFINDAAEKFSKDTNYIRATAYSTTKYNKYNYLLPKYILYINRVYYYPSDGSDKVELVRGEDWMRKDNTLIIYKSANIENTTNSGQNIKGGLVLELDCSKYPQTLDNDLDYLEMPRECEDAVTNYACYLTAIEDRRADDEKQDYLIPYIKSVEDFSDKNSIDSTTLFGFSFNGTNL